MTHSYRLIPLIIVGIVLTGLISAIAEEVTLTTYYPEPLQVTITTWKQESSRLHLELAPLLVQG